MKKNTKTIINNSLVKSLFVVFLLLGLMIGSFLNVVIHRLPVMIRIEWQKESFSLASEFLEDPEEKKLLRSKMVPNESVFNLAFPSSQCPMCGKRIRYRHNIPLIGFFFLRGRCFLYTVPVDACSA